jgi:sulfur-oxidizing protein SoxY
VAETSDGTLHMTKAFVKAAGGCSAPAVKDPAEARANAGKMRFRVFADSGEAQLQIRHPNNSGMQMDQVTRLYTPAWFVQALRIRQGDRSLFSMEGGISLSEDPTLRFSYKPDGGAVTAEVDDTDGNHFKQVFAGEGS